MNRHDWEARISGECCRRCGLWRRRVQSLSQRKRDAGAVVRYWEVRESPGAPWRKVSGGHRLPACARTP